MTGKEARNFKRAATIRARRAALAGSDSTARPSPPIARADRGHGASHVAAAIALFVLHRHSAAAASARRCFEISVARFEASRPAWSRRASIRTPFVCSRKSGFDWSAPEQVATEFFGEPSTTSSRLRPRPSDLPGLPRDHNTLHWGLTIRRGRGTDEQKLEAFRRTLTEVSMRIRPFVNSPVGLAERRSLPLTPLTPTTDPRRPMTTSRCSPSSKTSAAAVLRRVRDGGWDSCRQGTGDLDFTLTRQSTRSRRSPPTLSHCPNVLSLAFRRTVRDDVPGHDEVRLGEVVMPSVRRASLRGPRLQLPRGAVRDAGLANVFVSDPELHTGLVCTLAPCIAMVIIFTYLAKGNIPMAWCSWPSTQSPR